MRLRDSGYIVEVAGRIDRIDPSDWDALCEGRSFVDHRWQRLREAVYARYQPYYVQLRRRGRLEAAAVCTVARGFALPNSIPNPLLRAAWRRLLASSRPLRCGAFDSCQPALLTRPGCDVDHLSARLLEAIGHLAKQQRTPAVAVINLSPRDRAWRALRAGGYRAVRVRPNTYLDLLWPTFASYEAGLPSKKRRELRRYRRRAHEVGVTVDSLAPAAEAEPLLRRLVRDVFERHAAPDPHVPDLFSRARSVLGDDFSVLVARQGQRLIGCMALLRCADELTVEWLGLDYGRTRGTYTYHSLLIESVAKAIEMGVRRVWFGDTVYDLKRDVGASLEDRSAAVAIRNPVLNRFLGPGLALMGVRAPGPLAIADAEQTP